MKKTNLKSALSMAVTVALGTAFTVLSACSAMEPLSLSPAQSAKASQPSAFAGYWKTWNEKSEASSGSYDAYDIYIHVSQDGVAKGYIIAGNNCTQEGEVEWGQVLQNGVFEHNKATLEEFEMFHLTNEKWRLEEQDRLFAEGESIILNDDGSPSSEKEIYHERYARTSQAEYELLRQTCLQ